MGTVNRFDWLDYPDKYISYYFSLMQYTTTSGWVTSHSNAECLKQLSRKVFCNAEDTYFSCQYME